jgi:hypothetical protein
MILDKTVQIRISNKNYDYYKELGYDVNYNKQIEVDVSDLPSKSKAIVCRKCDCCLDEEVFQYRNVVGKEELCNDCYKAKNKTLNALRNNLDDGLRYDELLYKTGYEYRPTLMKEVLRYLTSKDEISKHNKYDYYYINQEVPEVKQSWIKLVWSFLKTVKW